MAAKHNKIGHSVALTMLILELMLSITSVSEAATSWAKPGCEQHCGNLYIPYPFGIGNTGCFHDEWFEVVCVNNNIPFLKKLKVEVTKIVFPINAKQITTGWFVTINNPIMTSPPTCASGTSKATTSTPLDFTGSPFHFSAVFNGFGGSGCTNQVSLIDNRGKLIRNAGCTSSCLGDANVNGDCCTIAVPGGTQVFNVFFSSTSATGADVGCKYAMLGLIDPWLRENRGTSCSSAMRNSDYVPALLEWGLKLSSDEAQVLLRQSNAENTTVGVQLYSYADGSVNQGAFCADGFFGSAYVPNGCQDMDECLQNPNPCNNNGTCFNTFGGYKCIPHKSNTTQIAIISACSIGGVLMLILAVWGGFELADRRQKKKYFLQNGGSMLKSEDNARQVKIFKAGELITATNNFSKKHQLGQGGQGIVYKGTLRNGTSVAIKRCNIIEPSKKLVDESGEAGDHIQGGAFIREVVLLSQTQHINIVSLLGCCLETEAPLLVYECLVNGDLAHYIHRDIRNNDDRGFTLSWEVRLKIAAEVAEGLSYLHIRTRDGIHHRDVKTDNILLDNNYTAKLADFGISQSVSSNKPEVGKKEAPGSAGYMDPEYMETRQYTAKSDVYSFGVVLAELLTGKRPVYSYMSQETGEEEWVILADYFKELKTGKIMGTLLDARVKREGKEEEVKAVIEIAKGCLEREGRKRPKMSEVAMELERIRSAQTGVYAEEVEDHYNYDPQMGVSDSPPRDQEITQPLAPTC